MINTESVWTHFWDMHSGGGLKEQWAHIFIEAPEAEATVIFYNRFGHNPSRVTCTCCGEDYVINETDNIVEETEFHRTRFREVGMTLSEFEDSKDVLFIRADEIRPEWRNGHVPNQGYVWVDETEEQT